MSDYEGKLGEWLKYVQQQVASVGKKDEEATPEEALKAEQPASDDQADEGVGRVIMRDRFGSIPVSERENVEMDSVLADSSLLNDPEPASFASPALFDETDVPDVEEFLPFLREPAGEPTREPAPEPEPWKLNDQNLDLFSEGTGQPKPLVRKPAEPEAQVQPLTPPKSEPAVREEIKPPVQQPQPRAQKTAAAPQRDAQASWDVMPKHLQILFSQTPDEVAQNSYKQFKENRQDLIARLLDPIISLEEAARVLNVCPTTVRRYTNRGALRHFRTAGNQRRFRLSDVLGFLEASGRPATVEPGPKATGNGGTH